MEFMLLAKVGVIIDTVVKAGYVFAGSYIVRTGIRYYKDYKGYVEQESRGEINGIAITYGNQATKAKNF